MIPLSAVVAHVGALLLAAPPASPAVGEVVARVLAAYGGRAALEKYPVMVQEGEVSAHESRDTGRVTRIFERPGASAWSCPIRAPHPSDASSTGRRPGATAGR